MCLVSFESWELILQFVSSGLRKLDETIGYCWYPIVMRWSLWHELRHELRLKMINCKNENKLKDLKSQRRSLLSDIRKLLKSEKEQEVKADLENLENCKNDSNKYHQVNRELRNKTPKQPIYVADQNGNVPGTTDGQNKYHKRAFYECTCPRYHERQVQNISAHSTSRPH